MVFRNLTAEQVNSVHTLFLFLHSLKVIGTVHTDTKSVALSEYGRPRVYDLFFEGYDHSTRGMKSSTAKLEAFFRRIEELGDDSYTERLK